MQINNELYVSYQILKNVYISGEYVNISLNKILQETKNKEINVGFITKVCYGVIHKNITLDYYLKNFIKQKTKPQLIILFKMGAYIKHFLNSMPDFVIVNELVNLAKKIGYANISGFVNATLKNIIGTEIIYPQHKDTEEFLSIFYSYPLWLVKALVNDYGKEMAKNILAIQPEANTIVRVNTLKINANEFLKELEKFEINYKSSLLPNTFEVDYKKLSKQSSLKNLYFVQGIPSMVVANNVEINKGLVLDACSAPGGKSVLIATNHPQVDVFACDVANNRLKLIENYKINAGVKNLNISQMDATVFNESFINKFDVVLCDVPCSGSGVVFKKPDIFLNKTENNLNELLKIQIEILNNCSKYVKDGGELIYSTCSILKNENIEIIKRFLKLNSNFKLVKSNTFGIQTYEELDTYTFLPHISKTEGFFIGRMKKNDITGL